MRTYQFCGLRLENPLILTTQTSVPILLKVHSSQELLNNAANLSLSQQPSFVQIVLGTVVNLEAGHRNWSVFPISVDLTFTCEAISKN